MGLVRYETGEISAELRRAARSRVRAHLDHLAMVDYDLRQLAVNCYLQGTRDMAETIIRRPGLLSPPSPEPDYQI